METDIRKATYTLYNFTGDNKIEVLRCADLMYGSFVIVSAC